MVVSATGEFAVLMASLLDDIALVSAGQLDDLGITLTQGFGALTHPVRKKALELMADEGVLTRTELAEAVATDEGVPREDADRLKAAMHHNHLPKLDDHQYVEYDERNGDVVLWTDPETVRSLLDSDTR